MSTVFSRYLAVTILSLLAGPIIAFAAPVTPAPEGHVWQQVNQNTFQAVPAVSIDGVVGGSLNAGGGVITQAGVQAVTGAALSPANAMCNPVIPACPCGTVPSKAGCVPGPNMFQCPCYDVTLSFMTVGFCAAPVYCQAIKVPGLLGIGMQVGQGVVSSILRNALGGGSQQRQGGGTGTRTVIPPTPTGCRQYYRTSVPSSDPCAVYVPATSTSSVDRDYVQRLLDALRQPQRSGTQTVTPPARTTQQTQTPAVQQRAPDISDSLFNWAQFLPQQPKTPQQPKNTFIQELGSRSEFRITPTSATLEAGFRDDTANVETSAFFGTGSGAGTPSPAQRLCLVRPWQHPIVSTYLHASLFDSLCTNRGFAAGVSATPDAPVVPAPARRSSTPPASKTTVKPTSTPAYTGPYVEPSIDIWAVPSRVSIGSRTSIYWYSKGVVSCTVTSPDGSFKQGGLSNLYGASTVPLSDTTVFSLSCLTPDNRPITDYVTVNVGG